MTIEIILACFIVVLFLIGLYFFDRVLPYTPSSFFSKVLYDFRRVESGELSFFDFKNHYQRLCCNPESHDFKDTVRFKQDLLDMLEEEDFIIAALSNREISIEILYRLWKQCDPLEYKKGCGQNKKVIPNEFAQGLGKQYMAFLVAKGHCDPDTLEWRESNESPSYLMVLFADAIGKNLGFGRKRWSPFVQIWGKRNYSDLMNKAMSSRNLEELADRVRELFPDYITVV